MCYVIYFMMFLGSPEATKKSFPVARMKALLPNWVEDEVSCTVYFLILGFSWESLENEFEIVELSYFENISAL